MSILKFKILANTKAAKLLTAPFSDCFLLADYMILSCLTSSCVSVIKSFNLINFVGRQYPFPNICLILF